MYTRLFFFLLLSIAIAVSYAVSEDEQFRNCSGEAYSCGQFQNLNYPFWGGNRPQFCGHKDFKLACLENEYPIIQVDGAPFRIHDVSQTNHTMKLSRFDLRSNFCTVPLPMAGRFNLELFQYGSDVKPLFIYYDCVSDEIPTEYPKFSCDVQGRKRIGLFANDSNLGSVRCAQNIDVLVSRSGLDGLFDGSENLQEVLDDGFAVEYNNAYTADCARCEGSRGVCGSDPSESEFVCLCLETRDQTDQQICSAHGTNKRNNWLMVTIAGTVSALGVGILVVRLIMCWRRRTKNDPSLENLIKQHGFLALKRYSYSDIKKMTNSFKDKLGQGGFGSVYKGKLPDGHLVAVKILNVLKGNGEDFINEVASISRTSHVNVVTLRGYCLQGNKRALVYDLMPHGSLEKFICYKSNGEVGLARLDWETLYKITVGIARGLEYLHSGCNTRILHFDIKPHNILLDEDFCPKISDFGLAKLCTRKESIVSMVGARGTVGYIAPEVFCRNFGGVSYKSDVYSYGMMVLEMVGARKKVVDHQVGSSTSSECYFPQWIYKRLEAGGDLELQGDMTAVENEITKKMTMVGLWCIQTDPSQRPSMGRVLEMLEGSIGGLELPPQPFLISPSTPMAEYSTTLTVS